MADLAELQRQFYERVVAGEPAGGLIASGDVEVYAGMYTTRLIDAIAEDYPKLRAALGEDRFGNVVARYVRAHPPWSFTLREAGAALAAFLRDSELAPAWAADLAALERARIEVFDGPDAEPLTQEVAAALGDGLPELALAWVPASVVVPLAWTVDALWSALEDEQPFEEPVQETRVVLAWRRDLSVLHRTLDADEGRLAPLIAQGSSFAAVCELLGELHGDAASGRAVELLLRWLGAAALRTAA
ncbi:MAG: HvfC/BufC family peptide modification chaperone [bacterium]